MLALRHAQLLIASLVAAAACTGEPAARASAPDAPTSRMRGQARFTGESAALLLCDGRTSVRLLPSGALTAARTRLGADQKSTWDVDVEAAPTADSSWDIAVVHRLRRADSVASTSCQAPLVEVDARDSAGSWIARFTKDSLLIVHRSASGAFDSLRLAVSRAPAIDGTVLYRTAAAAVPRVTLVVSPIQEGRGLREGTAQVNTRVEGCVLDQFEWRNATARLEIDDRRWAGCATYAEPLRDPTKTRRRF
jgi:hypothetical protein